MMRSGLYVSTVFSLIIFISPEANAQDVSKGRDFFIAQCLGCHAFTCNKEGPRLGGLFGRKVAAVEDYEYYTQELRDSGVVWTEKSLDDFFKNPGRFAPSSVMAGFGKIEDSEQRQQLIAFLKTEDTSVNLCPQE